MLQERVAAVILKGKKLMLVTDDDMPFYWTPGGKIEHDESHESSLGRELEEELSIKLVSMRHYLTIETFNDTVKEKQKVHYYFVEYEGKPTLKGEITEVLWYSKENFEKKQPKISTGVETCLIPKLIEDQLLA